MKFNQFERIKLKRNMAFTNNISEQRKTKMCKFEQTCFKYKQGTCSFAHTKEELFVPKCRFGTRCRNKFTSCTFSHDQTSGQLSKIDKPCKFGVNCKNKERCCFLHKTDEKPVEEKPAFLPPSLGSTKDFPDRIKNDNKSKNIFNINFTEIKKYIDFVDFIVIKEKNIKDMIKEYGFIRDFKKVSFVFE